MGRTPEITPQYETDDPLARLADEIVDFGADNLYGPIQTDRTRRLFEDVRGHLVRAGVPSVPQSSDFDFSVW